MTRGLAAVAAAALLIACGTTGVQEPPPRSLAGPVTDWPMYHGDAAHHGVPAAPASVRFRSAARAWVTGDLDGDVYASPVVVGGLVVVATENDTLYAFDALSGARRWSRHLADPVAASTLPCGAIRPVTGITGTPVADPARGLLYVVAFVRGTRHVLFTVDLASGATRSSVPADPPGDPATTLQQRGALALASGTVYVAYGGLEGDCGPYHGWVVGLPEAGGAAASYRVPCGRACGLWAPGGPTVGPGGDLWVASGNSDSTATFDYGNAAMRLTPDLRLGDWFAPANWAALSAADQDLGSISPALLDGGLAWISGKDGTGYLLRQDHLGHVGGQAASGRACPSYGGTAYAAPVLFLSCSGEIAAVRVDASGPSFSVRWGHGLASPGAPIVAGGALWTIETGTGRVWALDPGDGHALYHFDGGGSSSAHFATPAASGDGVYAAVGRRLVAIAVQAG